MIYSAVKPNNDNAIGPLMYKSTQRVISYLHYLGTRYPQQQEHQFVTSHK